jgi:hypothetical protein
MDDGLRPIQPQDEVAFAELAAIMLHELEVWLRSTCACCAHARPAETQVLCDGCLAAECESFAWCNRDLDLTFAEDDDG